jgi:biotin transport system substrate-specific component
MYNIKEAGIFERTGYLFFDWSRSLTTARKFVFALFVAFVTAVSAQIRITLPWTPVPITLQTFFVLLAGVLLGRNWGGISQIIYVGIGMATPTWFAGKSIFGPTGGYLIGFVLSAFFLGYVVDKYRKSRSFINVFLLMLFANFFLIYIPGLIHLGFYFYLIKGTFPGLRALLTMGFYPFVPGDLIKVVLASSVTTAIIPKNTAPSD